MVFSTTNQFSVLSDTSISSPVSSLHVSLTIPLSSYLTGLSQVPHGYNDPDVDGPGCMLTSFDSVIRNIEKYVRVTFGPFLEHRPLKRL
jgi:hypothetical protein